MKKDDCYFDWLIRLGLFEQASIQFGIEDMKFAYGRYSLHVVDYTVNLTSYAQFRTNNQIEIFKVHWDG